MIDIYHTTVYKYDSPVFSEPHHLYFYPAQRSHIRHLGAALSLDPTPSGLVTRVDSENNIFYQCWFKDELSSLKIAAHMKVEMHSVNPFDFLIEAEQPFPETLQPYLHLSEPLNDSIRSWVEEYALNGSESLNELVRLNKTIGEEWGHDVRYHEGLLPVVDTFKLREGSCRDISWMLMQILRHKGLPARFISGYAFSPELGTDHELHAWVECYLPGAGWVALDPTAGMLVDEHYVPVSGSFDPKLTLPVQGTYRGEARSHLSWEVIIEKSG